MPAISMSSGMEWRTGAKVKSVNLYLSIQSRYIKKWMLVKN